MQLSKGTVIGIGVGVVLGLAVIVFLALVTFYYRRKALRSSAAQNQVSGGGADEQQQYASIPKAESYAMSDINTADSPQSPLGELKPPGYQELESRPAPLYELSSDSVVSGAVEMEVPGLVHEAPSSWRAQQPQAGK